MIDCKGASIGQAYSLTMSRPYIAKRCTYKSKCVKKSNRTTVRWVRFTVIASLMIFMLFLLVNFYADSKEKVDLIEVTVASGDTLWSIAKDHFHVSGDIREFIYSIQKLNKLTSAQIYPGQVILIPLME